MALSPVPAGRGARVALAVSLVAALAAAPAALAVSLETDDPLGTSVQQDASQWDGARWDGSQWDGSQWDASQWDASQWDASRWDASSWDASSWDASSWDASSWDASQWDSFLGYDPLYPYQWGHRATNVPGAWALVGPGDGATTLCIVDSGVDYTHPDLAPNMWRDPATGAHGHDFVDDDADPMDVGGHGTHVASVAAAVSGDAYGVAGMADAQIMAVRVIGPDGTGSNGDYVRGIQWCADRGADVVSVSLSIVGTSQGLANVVNYAASKGSLVILSGGNSQCGDCYQQLVKLPGVLVVTAIGPDGNVAPFTTYHDKVDFGAPGVDIAGAVPGPSWVMGSGSSQAVPHASGAAALVWAADPALGAADVARILADSAAYLGEDRSMRFLDAQAAVQMALSG